MNKIKILALMDSPTVSTGFGILARNVLKKLEETGKYEITVIGINFTGTLSLDKIKELPFNFTPAMPQGYNDPYGRGRTIQILSGIDRDIKPPFDLLFTIQDHFILYGGDHLAQGYNFSKRIKDMQMEILKTNSIDLKYLFNWIGYYPVDGSLQERWVSEGIGYCDYPVAYTRFGYDEILKYDNEDINLKKRLSIIPHGVNTKDFYPISEEEKKEFRKTYLPENFPEDGFLITNVSRNQIRKDIASTIKIFSEYKKINPKAYLYLHMRQTDNGGDIWEIAKQFGLKVGQDLMLPNNFNEMYGIPVSVLNKIYNISDVLITTTLGEGWGFINTEAMAVKKPLLAPANTSIPEIIGMSDIYEKEVGIDYLERNIGSLRGIPVKSGYNLNDFVCMGELDNGVVRPKVDIEDAVIKLDWIYKNKEKANQIANQGYEYVQSLEWGIVVKEWEKLFDKAYSDLEKERSLGHITENKETKQNRNDLCNCGSGKKFKKCCIK